MEQYMGTEGKRELFYLRVVRSSATDRTNETLWVFEDEQGRKAEWWTTSSQILIEKKWYYVKATVKKHVDDRTSHVTHLERLAFL